MLFKFYDNMNKGRLRKLQRRAKQTYDQSEKLTQSARTVMGLLERINKTN